MGYLMYISSLAPKLGKTETLFFWLLYPNITQMTIISTTVGRNPLEEME